MATTGKKLGFALRGMLKQRLRPLMASRQDSVKLLEETYAKESSSGELPEHACLTLSDQKDLSSQCHKVEKHHQVVGLLDILDADKIEHLTLCAPFSALFLLDTHCRFAADTTFMCLSHMTKGPLHLAKKAPFGSSLYEAPCQSWQALSLALEKSGAGARFKEDALESVDLVKEWFTPEKVHTVSDGESERIVFDGEISQIDDTIGPLLERLKPLPFSAVCLILGPDQKAQLSLLASYPYKPLKNASAIMIISQKSVATNLKNLSNAS